MMIETDHGHTVDNGRRFRLEIAGVHAGDAGFATPSNSERAAGADLVAAFRPNVRRTKLTAGMIAETPAGRFRIVAVHPSHSGLTIVYLTDA